MPQYQIALKILVKVAKGEVFAVLLKFMYFILYFNFKSTLKAKENKEVSPEVGE